jgi:dipeptidyl aminopeptidase/acylaminoacyl peptidase
MADVFISYSRKDIAFARLLNEALGQSQLETWIDWARIPVGEKWWDEICAAIEQAGIFLFIISRHSVGSEVCKKEVDEALSHNKRVIPVIVDDTPEAAIREFVPELTAINWIIFRKDDVFRLEPRAGESLPPEEQVAALATEPQFRQAIEKLNAAIHTDWAWVKAQSRLESRAREWERHDREGSRLLRGKDLGEAEQWLSQVNARYDPQPTDVQRQYVLAGRRAESRRQRRTLWASLGAAGVISICLVIAMVLGALAWQAQQTAQSEANARATEVIARSTAEAQALSAKATAEANLALSEKFRLAAEAENILVAPDGNAETAALLSLQALKGGYLPQADISMTKSLARVYFIRAFSGHTDSITSIAFSPDSKYVLTGSKDTTARLWDAATGAQVRTFSGHTSWVNSVAFSPDAKYVLTGSTDHTVKLWDAATGAQVRTFTGHTEQVNSVAFSPDGKYVLSGGVDKAMLWDVTTGAQVRSFGDFVDSVAFSPDGKYMLTDGSDEAQLWDATTGAQVRTFSGHTDSVVSVSFSPDGKYVLTGSWDNTARLWDAATGAQVRTFNGHTSHVDSVAFSPDGRYVLTGSADTTAKLWDAATGAVVRTYSGPTIVDSIVAFSPDGRYVATGGDDTANLWGVATSAAGVAFGTSSRHWIVAL